MKVYPIGFLRRLSESVFINNLFVVMSGTVAAQIIGFILTPVISRLFSPSDFGVFGSFEAVGTVIAMGVTLDYSQAIMLPKQKADALCVFALSCMSTFLIAGGCLIFCCAAPTLIHDLVKSPNAWVPALLVLSILVSGLNQSCQAWCVRVKAFKHTSASQVVRSLSCSGSQVGMGYFNGGPVALIISRILADILASINLLRVLLPDLISLRHLIRRERIKELAIEYRDFPCYSATQNIISALSQGLPVLLLTHFYGIAVAGAYAFGLRILYAPQGLVLTALRQVLFQKAAETASGDESLMPLYLKTTLALFCIALFPALVLFIWSPQIFTLIFGHQWLLAGEFAQGLILWMLFAFCNVPSVLFARILRMQQTVFFYSLFVLFVRSLVLIGGGMYLSSYSTILIFSLTGAALNFLLILIVGCALMRREGASSLRGIMGNVTEGSL
ncbi:MAG: lipopolysaccharide biosynthesis protein [Syntrophobacteraceae bacterium]